MQRSQHSDDLLNLTAKSSRERPSWASGKTDYSFRWNGCLTNINGCKVNNNFIEKVSPAYLKNQFSINAILVYLEYFPSL